MYTSSRLAFVCQVQSGRGQPPCLLLTLLLLRLTANICDCFAFDFPSVATSLHATRVCSKDTHTSEGHREEGKRERESQREQAYPNGGAFTVTVNDFFFILYQLVIVGSPTHKHTPPPPLSLSLPRPPLTVVVVIIVISLANKLVNNKYFPVKYC